MDKTKNARFWALSPPQEVAAYFGVDLRCGLSAKEVQKRKKEWGSNIIQEKKQKGIIELLLDQFRDFMVLVLLAATLISGLLGEYTDAVVIIVIVIINALLGFVQEYRAERSFAALKRLSAPRGTVLRDGILVEVPSEEVVPGDILLLKAGDRTCADVRLVSVKGLLVDESPLTGESVASEKEIVVLRNFPSSPGDAANMAFSGTLIKEGEGRGVVVATGMRTEMGCIASLMQDVERQATPLQKRLARLGRYLVLACLFLCLLVVLLGMWRGEDIYKMFMAGITLAVAAIPEGLPAIVTISLALGVQRMARRRAIVRRLPAVETLGCATVICADKTGTITQNRMTVKKIYAGGSIWDVGGEGYEPRGDFFLQGQKVKAREDEHLLRCLTIAVLCNNSLLSRAGRGSAGREWDVSGNPTEGALLACAAKAGIWKEKLEQGWVRLEEEPFSSARKYMTVTYRRGGQLTVMVKGAPERVLEMCTGIYAGGRVKKLDQAERRRIMSRMEQMASEALRTIAVAYRDIPAGSVIPETKTVEGEMIFAGFLGLFDPPRPEVYKAVHKCKKAGIRVVMITGDHRNTAVAVAEKLGIIKTRAQVMTGSEMDSLSDHELGRRIEHITVFARVNPEHKLKIVRCLKGKGHVVAMTGDGINDAPAVKEADIGIAMGMSGTEVTRESASLILSDDNFSTIVAAVEEGRSIYDNIRKFIRFLLGCNAGEILIMLVAMLMGLPLPLRPIQILWVNLATDGLPALALGMEPPEKGVMVRPPRPSGESIFGRGLWLKILGRGVTIGLTSAAVFALAWFSTYELVYAQTMALTTLIVTQLMHVFECRSEEPGAWETPFSGNPLLVAAVAVSFVLLACILYYPFLQEIFRTYPLNPGDWAFIFLVSSIPYVLNYFQRCCGKIYAGESVNNK